MNTGEFLHNASIKLYFKMAYKHGEDLSVGVQSDRSRLYKVSGEPFLTDHSVKILTER